MVFGHGLNLQQAILPWKTATTSLSLSLILRLVLLVTQHTSGPWEGHKPAWSPEDAQKFNYFQTVSYHMR